MDTFDITPTGENRKTMSSFEIAELTGKRHDNIMRDIRKMLIDLNVPKSEAVDFVSDYTDAKGEKRGCFRLPRRECLILVSGYDVALRARIIDRWEELERERLAAPTIDPAKVLNDPAALRGLLLQNVEKVLALEAQVDAMTPKATALARLSESDGSVCFTDAAKTLQQRPKDLIQKLRTGWIYTRQGGGYVAYQDKIQKGLLEHKSTTVTRPDGTEKIVFQVRVTPIHDEAAMQVLDGVPGHPCPIKMRAEEAEVGETNGGGVDRDSEITRHRSAPAAKS